MKLWLPNWFGVVVGVLLFVFSLEGMTLMAQDMETPQELKPVVEAYDKGRELMTAQKDAEALAQFAKAIEMADKLASPDAKRILAAAANNSGAIRMKQNELTPAEAFFRQAIAKDPIHSMAWNNLGTLQLARHQYEEARKSFEKALEIDKTNYLAMNNIAAVLIRTGDYALALKILRSSVVADPACADTYVKTAEVFNRLHASADEEKIWLAWMTATNNSVDARLKLTEFYLRQKRFADAATVIETIEKGKSLPVERVRAAVLANQNKQQEALSLLEGLRAEHPDDFAVINDLVTLLLRIGKVNEAKKLASRATQSHPMAASWYLLGLCEDASKDEAAAEKSYRKAVELAPEHPQALNNLGVIAINRKETASAIEYFEKSVRSDLGYEDAQYNLGRCLVMTMKDYKRGIRILGEVAKSPSDSGLRAREFLAQLKKSLVDARPAK